LAKEKMIFAAAGTFGIEPIGVIQPVGVIFPANLPTSHTLAITGVKNTLDNENNTISCSTCFDGPEVDFVTIIQRTSNGNGPLTLASAGDFPKYTNGSSAATATAAGIAALVWSASPNETKDQIIDRLKNSTRDTQFDPIVRGNKHGWGRIDAFYAIVW